MAANSLKLTVSVLFMVKVSGPTSGEAPPDGCGDQKKKDPLHRSLFSYWPLTSAPCFAPKMFELKSCFALQMFEQSVALHHKCLNKDFLCIHNG